MQIDKAFMLSDIEQKLQECTQCTLHSDRTHMVFGRGFSNADIMMIGEGPGKDEDLQGQPFVGKSGQLLQHILKVIDLPTSNIYIANVVKCRPPNNRLPNAQEVAICKSYLREQIRIVNPKIIVVLGALAAQTLISPDIRITKARGNWYEKGKFLIMPTFHPAAVLRDINKEKDIYHDLRKVKEAYGA